VSWCCHAAVLQEFTQEEFAGMLRFSGSNFKVELVLRLLGLAHARDTLLGSAMVSQAPWGGVTKYSH
jgi:hypothetical protein